LHGALRRAFFVEPILVLARVPYLGISRFRNPVLGLIFPPGTLFPESRVRCRMGAKPLMSAAPVIYVTSFQIGKIYA
jgi:hypothetical protein